MLISLHDFLTATTQPISFHLCVTVVPRTESTSSPRIRTHRIHLFAPRNRIAHVGLPHLTLFLPDPLSMNWPNCNRQLFRPQQALSKVAGMAAALARRCTRGCQLARSRSSSPSTLSPPTLSDFNCWLVPPHASVAGVPADRSAVARSPRTPGARGQRGRAQVGWQVDAQAREPSLALSC